MSGSPLSSVVAELGTVFARFDERTQDSGHVSYGVRDDAGRRWFVKTSGDASVSPGGATNAERRALLRNSAAASVAVAHPALPATEQLVEAADGVALVSRWFDGELLREPAAGRRFRELPAAEVVRALDAVVDVHVALAAAGWVAGDFYDGSLMYDFARREIALIDLECYRRGAYRNDVGRLPGSTRFMAPEELTLGATVDERTTVFNLARMVQLLLAEQPSGLRELLTEATRETVADRPSLTVFQARWRHQVSGLLSHPS